MTLKIEKLSAARGGRAVIENVSFSLAPGQALILRGPNGSGKTTLLRTLAGLQPATAGDIEVASESIAYSGHLDGLKGTLTVAENLRFWARLFGTSGIDHALRAFELSSLHDRHAQNLSAGQKRRLGLARLLVTGRPLWLLDEPTVSLDVDAIGLFASVVTSHLATGGSALIATHVALGIDAETLDMNRFRPTGKSDGAFEEAFA